MSNKPLNKIKIHFVLATLRAGGAERVYSYISQNLDKSRFQATLIVFGRKADAVFDTSGVDTVFFEKANASKAVPLFIKYLKKHRPQLVCGSVIHINVIMGAMKMLFPSIKFIGREVSIISLMDSHMPKTVPFQKQLRKFFYNRLDSLICQSHDMASDLIKKLKIRENKLKVISNPISLSVTNLPESVVDKGMEDLRIITVGRLSAEKGHQKILNVLQKLKRPFKYVVAGDGPLKEHLMSYAQGLGLTKKIVWLGHTSNVADYLLKSDVFVQGSEFEGFPNALLEANYCGIPAITFNAPGGTKEIIQAGINGNIYNESPEMKNALENFDKKNWDSQIIRESVLSRYSARVIINKYESFFDEVINEG